MATAVGTEILAGTPALSTQKSLRRRQSFKRDLRPEERTDLTIEEAEELAQGHSFELIEGRMVFKMPDRKHSKIQAALTTKLFNYFEQNPIGEVLPEFSLRLWPENVHRLPTPDVAVFLNENIHVEEKYATRAPDLAIEIVSDDDKAAAVFAKARMYLEKGSRVVWIVFPLEKSVVIMTPTGRRWESNALTCPELLPGFSIQVAQIFSELERNPSPASKKTSAKANTNGKSRSRRK